MHELQTAKPWAGGGGAYKGEFPSAKISNPIVNTYRVFPYELESRSVYLTAAAEADLIIDRGKT